ncbi:glycerol-3-phosphate responsive antiterminator [Eubacterium barkeri]|uniref:Glycerol uptake operon antiterminator n=1 Tax=Eubacterium barkeri TaxID=1528 RepID=A0A1H3GU03_EUBBA|nr:glycerol-3-phosphate responsive antiterminator [Eubacterium barkeri]SDY06803.1 glycerol uptake operon antiterminator [Eubacterium barkeri]
MNDFDTFQIIPSIRRLGDLADALASDRHIILLTDADIANLPALVQKVHQAGKKAWINMELLGGFGRDQAGIKLLKNYFKVDGVMSTDSAKLGIAKRVGLTTIQRFLIGDSRAYDTSLRLLRSVKTDAAEILPAAVAQEILPDLRKVTDMPLLAGGFIHSAKEIDALQKSGFEGLTISKKKYWSHRG